MKPFVPIILVVISVGVFYLYIDPNYAEVKSLLGKRAEFQSAIANIETLKELRDSLETQIGDISKENADRLEKAIPHEINSVKLTSDLDSLAGRRGMALRNVRVSDGNTDSSGTVSSSKQNGGYKTTTMSFSVVSSYPNFIAFLKDLEKSLQIVDVRSISMRGASGEGAQMQFDMTIQTYWIK